MQKRAAPRRAEPVVVSARDEAKQETREALLRAGMEIFSKEGLDAPSLDAICARAGFTRGAFYVHFEDREDFIAAVMERATGSFLDTILAPGEGGAADLGRALGAFATASSEGRLKVFGEVPPHQLLAACARSPALRKRYQKLTEGAIERLGEMVRAGQRAGVLRGDVAAAQIARILVATALGIEVLGEVRVPFDGAAGVAAMLKLLMKGG